MNRNLYQTIQDILKELREGKRNFSSYLKWLQDCDLETGEAEDLLDRLLKQVEDE